MRQIPSRDISGVCEGECRDLVRETAENQQKQINSQPYTNGENPSVSWARSRNEQPGFYGGHV